MATDSIRKPRERVRAAPLTRQEVWTKRAGRWYLQARRWLFGRKWTVQHILAVAGVLAIIWMVLAGIGGAVHLVSSIKWPHFGKPKQSTATTAGTGSDTEQLGKIEDAPFTYLAPADNRDWKFDKSSLIYVPSKKVVRYDVYLNNAKTDVTVTEQAMPEALGSRESAAFTKFIADNKVSISQGAGLGTIYLLPALQNGAPAAGADTVIYATDNLLMFGKAGQVVSLEAWVKLMGSMKLGD